MTRILPPILREIRSAAGAPIPGPAYVHMIETMRGFLDQLAVAALDEASSQRLADHVSSWSALLSGARVDESSRMFGYVEHVAGHGQLLSPPFEVEHRDETSVSGKVMFGEYFLGFNGRVHGGAIALVFDEMLAIVANSGVPTVARTARLAVNFRSVAPVGRQLAFRASLLSVDGRKRTVRCELVDGDTVCAEADGLFIELRQSQR